MKWFIENWSLLVVIAAVIFLGAVYANRFMRLPSDGKINLVKQWALFIVIEMEKTYGQGTGSLKLAAAYDAFIKAFPDLVPLISFELFSKIIDEALERMRHLLSTNLDIKNYVDGGD